MLKIEGIEPGNDLYKADFLTKEFADELFELCKTLPNERPVIPRSGHPMRRLKLPCYSATPNWRGSQNEKTNKWMMHIEQAPDAIQKLAAMLTERAGKLVNYLSLVGYGNEKDHINWHQHSEDECGDARVFIVSLGETRTFGLRPVCEEGRLCGRGNEAVCNGGGCSCETCKGARKHRKTACKTCKDKSKWIFFQPVHGSLSPGSLQDRRYTQRRPAPPEKDSGLLFCLLGLPKLPAIVPEPFFRVPASY